MLTLAMYTTEDGIRILQVEQLMSSITPVFGGLDYKQSRNPIQNTVMCRIIIKDQGDFISAIANIKDATEVVHNKQRREGEPLEKIFVDVGVIDYANGMRMVPSFLNEGLIPAIRSWLNYWNQNQSNISAVSSLPSARMAEPSSSQTLHDLLNAEDSDDDGEEKKEEKKESKESKEEVLLRPQEADVAKEDADRSAKISASNARFMVRYEFGRILFKAIWQKYDYSLASISPLRMFGDTLSGEIEAHKIMSRLIKKTVKIITSGRSVNVFDLLPELYKAANLARNARISGSRYVPTGFEKTMSAVIREFKEQAKNAGRFEEDYLRDRLSYELDIFESLLEKGSIPLRSNPEERQAAAPAAAVSRSA